MERSLRECDSKLSFRVGRAGIAQIRKASIEHPGLHTVHFASIHWRVLYYDLGVNIV